MGECFYYTVFARSSQGTGANFSEKKPPGSKNSSGWKKGEKGEIEHVRVLGPFRSYTQVEISKTDAFKLGVNPPVRESGDVLGSEKITIIGTQGTLESKECCIIADRHIHILKEQAKMYNLDDVEEVSVMIDGEKGGIINHVKLRVSDSSYFEMHLDTDDANAHLVKNGDLVEIIKVP